VNLAAIQEELRKQKLDGWLFFDHHVRDPLAYRVLGLDVHRVPTRRWYYFIPAAGEPRGLVHRIEAGMIDTLPGEKIQYSRWTEHIGGLQKLVAGARRIAMQYSPNCAIFYVSMVDAGTVELVRSTGVEVVSSADLIQTFEARWTPEALQSHLEAGRRVDRVRREAFQMIGERTRNGGSTDELAVKNFVLQGFAREGLFTDHGPIVGANANAANPHYEPTDAGFAPIRRGDFVLLDMWAKLDEAGSVYYDITWTGVCGEPSAEQHRIFGIVRDARDAAIGRVQRAVSSGEAIRGFDVDDAARGVIEKAGFGEYFVHRTGHSIGQEVHGNGANMDNLETHDERRVMPWSCFSVEPGIYLKDFGVRSEINLFVGDGEALVTGEIQTELLTL
jgi:Xaa-Pro dipeptidase